jgi:4-amino-4-deoxy-L-arabinose transferase-like glycosyltransferase
VSAPLPPPGAPSEPSPWAVRALLLLALLPYGLGLGEPPLWDANEPLYAEPPREALETGEWLAPTWNYRRWFVRPPLATWITLPSYAALGVNPFAARLPSALLAMATILCAYGLGRALGGRRAGVLAALVLSATPRFWLFSRQLAGDVLLTACLAGAFLLALPALEGRPEGRRRVLWAHALVGVGVLAKGPVIGVLWLGPLLAAARLSRPRVPLRALRLPSGLAIAAAVALPWFAYMTARYGWDYPREFLGHHHIRRAISEDVGARPPWYLPLALLGDAQPWLVFVPFALHRAWKGGARDPATMLAWAGAAFPLVFFSIPAGKRNVYLLPLYPMLAAAVSPLLVECLAGGRKVLVQAVGLSAALVAALAAVLAWMATDHVPADIAARGLWYVGICAAAAVGLVVASLRASGRGVVAGLLLAVLATLVCSAASLPVLGKYMPVPRLAAALVRTARPGDAAVVYGTSVHSLMYYARRPTTVARNPAELLAELPRGGTAFVLGWEDVTNPLRALENLSVREVDRAPYFRFKFSANVLGEGPSTRDLVLLEVARREPAAPPPAREAPDDPGR